MEMIATTKRKYDTYTHEQLIELVAYLQQKIASLTEALFQKKSERFQADPLGMTPLFDEVEQIDDSASRAEAEKTEQVAGFVRKKRGHRKPLPDNLPRERVEYDLSEEEKLCPIHKVAMEKIGEKIAEKLEFVPAKIKVLQEVRLTYKCLCCSRSEINNTLVTAAAEPSIIPKSFATPSLLAAIATAKYQDGLPLYRQEKIFLRGDIDLDRTTMARWMITCANAAQPLVNLMQEDLLERTVIGCDETTLQVLKEPQRNPSQKSYMWVSRTMEGVPIIIFDYHEGRSAKTAEKVLGAFQGVVVCDGLKSYDSFAAGSSVQLAACMAHIRRKFFNAHKALKKADPKGVPKTAQPLALIKELYKIEAALKEQPSELVLQERQTQSQPLMARLKEWLDTQSTKVLPKSLLGKAISYAQHQWEKMLVFLENPLVPIDNNASERSIRPFVIGRKNWLFAATPAGAHSSATIYSLIESAKENGIEPYEYLTLIFKELPKATTAAEYQRLLPHEIKKHYPLKDYRIPT